MPRLIPGPKENRNPSYKDQEWTTESVCKNKARRSSEFLYRTIQHLDLLQHSKMGRDVRRYRLWTWTKAGSSYPM
ncbi:hypothetical protein AVEN_141537-1, partial [Araneus ventricosus]